MTEGRDGAVMGQKPMQFVGCRPVWQLPFAKGMPLIGDGHRLRATRARSHTHHLPPIRNFIARDGRSEGMATEPKPMPKWKIDTIEAAIQDLQRLKVPITASRIHKRTGPSVTLDEIRHYAAHRFGDPKD